MTTLARQRPSSTISATCPRLLSLAAALCLLAGCDDGTDGTEVVPLGCGTDGQVIEVDGDPRGCLYDKSLIIETGFMCPADAPNGFELAGAIVCSPDQTLSDDIYEQVAGALGVGTGAIACAPICGPDEVCDIEVGQCESTAMACVPVDGVCPVGCADEDCMPMTSSDCLTVSEASHDFGTIAIGETASSGVVIENCGTSDITLQSLTITGNSAASFSADLVLPTLLAEGESTQLGIHYAPENDGPHAAVLTVDSDSTVVPTLEVALSGNTVPASIDCPTAVATGVVIGGAGSPAPSLSVDRLDQVLLSGAASEAQNGGSIVEYQWSVASAPAGFDLGFIPNSRSQDVQIQISEVGDYVFELTVFDGLGTESCEPAQVSVTARPDGFVVELFWDTPSDPDQTDSCLTCGTDLDLMLLNGLDGAGWLDPTGTYAVSFRSRNPDWGEPNITSDDPSLDRDDGDGGGPEVISYQDPPYTDGSQPNGYDAPYQVGIYFFDNNGFAGPTHATVRVYLGGQSAPAAEWTATLVNSDPDPAGTGDFWVAGTIGWDASGPMLTEVGTITAGLP